MMINCNKCKLYGECDHQGAYQKDGRWCYEDRCKILIPVSCRSDDPLTRPMIEALEKEEWCEVKKMFLVSGNFLESYINTDFMIKKEKPNCIFISGDRIEMHGASVAAFYNQIKIIVYGSGITNTLSTFDDYNRHCISLYADVCLCEDLNSKRKTFFLWQDIGKIPKNISTSQNMFEKYNIHRVGNLYLDAIDNIDESLVPDEEYDLILCNKSTLGEDLYGLIPQRKTIYIGSNPDGIVWAKDKITYENLPRPQFLGLMKNCHRFITNSSSAYYEAPHFLKPEQIIQVGERNKNRSTPREWNQEYKSSDKIVKILRKWWEDK